MIEYIDEIDEEFGNENDVEYQCGCGWMNSDASISEKKARIEHGEPKFGKWDN